MENASICAIMMTDRLTGLYPQLCSRTYVHGCGRMVTGLLLEPTFHMPAVSPAHGSMYVYYDYESQWMHPSPSMMHRTNSLGTNALGVPHLHHHRRHC